MAFIRKLLHLRFENNKRRKYICIIFLICYRLSNIYHTYDVFHKNDWNLNCIYVLETDLFVLILFAPYYQNIELLRFFCGDARFLKRGEVKITPLCSSHAVLYTSFHMFKQGAYIRKIGYMASCV